MPLVSPGVSVQEVDVSYIIPTKFNFEVIGDTVINIHNWQWWDSNGIASKIHAWLDEHTELGADECCIGQHILFAKPEELTFFVLAWS